MDEGARRLERAALAGDREAALRFGVAVARSGELDLARINAARVAAGLPEVPGDASRGYAMYLLGAGESVLVRVNWDELVIELGLTDRLIYFDGSEIHTPDWIMDQAHDEAGFWIKYHDLDGKLTDDQDQAVVDQFYYAIESEWLPQKKLTRRLLERWIVNPINNVSEHGRRGLTRDFPEDPTSSCAECGQRAAGDYFTVTNHLTDDGEIDHDADADHLALPQPGLLDERDSKIRDMVCGGQAISIEKIDTRPDVAVDETGVVFKVQWPIWTVLYELGVDDAFWRDGPLELGRVTPALLMSLANEARHRAEIRVEMEASGDEYDSPGDEKIMEEIRKAAPTKKPAAKKKGKKRGRRNMGIYSINPSPESIAFERDMKAGQITPAAIERRLRQLKDELDDAIFFKHPAHAIASLRSQVRDMEEVLKGGWPHPEGDTARRERLEQEASARASEVERVQGKLDVAEREVSMLDADVREAVRMRDPEREIKRLREALVKAVSVRDALRLERDAALSGLQAMAAEAERELAAARHEDLPSKPGEQRRTFDGRPLDNESAAEIDRLLGMVRSGSLTLATVQDLMRNARRQYEAGTRSGLEAVKMHEIALRLMILDHVLHVGFKRSANRGRRR